MKPLVCLYEDRHTHIAAVQLLILSLRKYNPDLDIHLTYPQVSEAFIEWCSEFSNVTLSLSPVEGTGSYNIKPGILLAGLLRGASACLWLDTDIIVTKKLDFFNDIRDNVFISTLDPWPDNNGSNYRATAFGLKAQQKSVPGAVNSAVVLVSSTHKELLNDWINLLKLPEYQAQQKIPSSKRNPMMLGDQDALSALIASERYVNLDVILLTHPVNILHHQGVAALSISQRLQILNNSNLPPLVHAMNSQKPWMQLGNFLNFKSYSTQLFHETSPYIYFARKYKDNITGDKKWLTNKTIVSKILLFFFRENTLLAGAPLVVINNVKKFFSNNP